MKSVLPRQRPSAPLKVRSARWSIDWPDIWRRFLPAVALIIIVVWTLKLEPSAASYAGLNLLLSSTVPLILATMAQMFIIAAGDIDLGIGSYVGLVNVVGATYLFTQPPLGLAIFAGLVVLYMVMGALIYLRRLPSIVVTLGASFIWLGVAVLILPTPGGTAPGWLETIFNYNPPFVPLPIVLAVVVALIGDFIMMRSGYGVVLRGIGGNQEAVSRAGWSLLRGRAVLYGLAGVFGVLAGLAVTASTTSGDANASSSYTLLSIAAAILGGAEFTGGIVSPVGAVVGAITIGLVGSLLAFLELPPDYQIGVYGAILIVVLAGRAIGRRERT